MNYNFDEYKAYDEPNYDYDDKYDKPNYDYDYDDEYDEAIYDYEDEKNEQNKQNEKSFYVSRHLNSCNNMVDNIKWTNPSYKFSEPPLSMWGIISGLALQREPLGTFQNKVYVSCLVRTWMTAIIEYLPHVPLRRNKGKLINLIVSPYIKEADLSNKYYVGKTIDKGNMPVDINEQIEKIQYFFSFLVLIQKYFKQMGSKTMNETNLKSYNNNIEKIQKNLNEILLDGNKINIIFPSFNRKDVKISLEYNDSNKKLIFVSNELYDDYSYFDKIPKDKEFSLELLELEGQQGGTNYNYFESVLNAFLKQNINNEPNNVISVPLKPKKLKINNILKKSRYFNIPDVSAYTTSFGKESILLFINWIKNVIKDEDKDIYVVAHSNIMQATLYNICGKIKNTIIKKKNVNDCQEGLYNIVKKQNIWELVLKVTDDDIITSVEVRPGQEKPNKESEKVLNYGSEKELSCGKNIQNLERMMKENERTIEESKNKNKIIMKEGVRQPQLVPQHEPQHQRGFFGKIKNLFTRGKRGGRKYKKYTRKQNNKRTKKNNKKNNKRTRRTNY
jgi:hypothetical protein